MRRTEVAILGAGPAGIAAALAAARFVGHPLSPEHRRNLELAQARRRHELRFAGMLDDLFAMRPGIYELARPDTLLCRCEEVSLAEVQEALRRGARSLRAVRAQTRVRLGPCHGRMCSHLVAHAAARETGRPLPEVLDLTPRPPVKPVPLGVLAGLVEDRR